MGLWDWSGPQDLDWASAVRAFPTTGDLVLTQPRYKHEVVIALDTGIKYQGDQPYVGGWVLADGSSAIPLVSVELHQFLTRVAVQNAAHVAAYTALIDGHVADGDWDKFAGYYISAAAEAATALTNLKSSSYAASVVGGVTFTPDRGWTGNGTTGGINTTYRPFFSDSVMSQNSTHIGFYCRTSRAVAAVKNFGGALGTSNTNGLFIIPRFTGDQTIVQNMSGDFNNNTTENVQGHWINTRTGATTLRVAKNGVDLYTGATASAPTAYAEPLYILVLRLPNGTFFQFTDDQIACCHFGSALDAAAVTRVSARINAYMAAVGASVY